MPRKRTGTIVEQLGRDGVARHSLRVTSGGRRHFVSLGDVSHGEAQEQLDQALREIAAGVWESPRNARRFAEHPERFFERRGPDDCWLWTG
jgi:hypothetical protein